MAENLMQQALELYTAGDKPGAQVILSRILRTEPHNYNAWFGMALCLDDPEKQRYCLNQVLDIHPNHPQAREMLACLDLDARMNELGIDAEQDHSRMAEFVFSSFFENPDSPPGASYSYVENLDGLDDFAFSYPDELSRQGQFDFLFEDPPAVPETVAAPSQPDQPDDSPLSVTDRLVSDLRHQPLARRKPRSAQPARPRRSIPLALAVAALLGLCCLLGVPLSLAAAAVTSPISGGGLVVPPVYAVVSAEKGGQIKFDTVSVRFLPGALPEDTQVGVAPLTIGLLERGIAAGIQVVGVEGPLEHPAIFTFMLSEPVAPGLLAPLVSRSGPWRAWKPALNQAGEPLYGLVTADGLTVVGLTDHFSSFAVTYAGLAESQAEFVDSAVQATLSAVTPVFPEVTAPPNPTVRPTRQAPSPTVVLTRPAVVQPTAVLPSTASATPAVTPTTGVPAQPSPPVITLTSQAGGAPVCQAEQVVRDRSVTIAAANLPPNTNFAVLMSDMEKSAASGVQAAAFNSEADGALTFTFPIPPELAGAAHIAYWLQSSSGVVCFNWFTNQDQP